MRIKEMDGMRGLLAFWVLAGHVADLVGARIPVVSSPGQAVDLFMVLSGFFITATFVQLERKASWGVATRVFYVRRIMRIYPVYVVMFAIAWALLSDFSHWHMLLHEIFPPPWAGQGHGDTANYPPIDVPNAVAHLTMLFGVIPQYVASNALPDWSLSLEFQFYLLFPLLIPRVKEHPFIAALIAGAGALLTTKLGGQYLTPGLVAHYTQPSLISYKLPMFLAGVAICFLSKTEQQPAASATSWLPLLVLCAAQSASFTIAIGLALIVVLAFPGKGGVVRLLGTAPLAFLGRISYSVYLSHMLVVLPVCAALAGSERFLHCPSLLRFAISAAICMPLVSCLSYVMVVLVEEPGIRFAHRLSANWLPRLVTPVSSPTA